MNSHAFVLSLVIVFVSARLAPVGIELEYASSTSGSAWSSYTQEQLNSCGYIIHSDGSASSVATRTYTFNAPAGTYQVFGRVQGNTIWVPVDPYCVEWWCDFYEVYSDGCTLQFDSLPAFTWQGGWTLNFGWPAYYPMAWKPAMNVTLTGESHTLVVSTIVGVYSDMDKIILQDPKDYAPGHGDFGVVAQNIPSGYCLSGYFEAEYGTLSGSRPPTWKKPVQGAGMEGILVRTDGDTTSDQCSNQKRNVQISASFATENSAYRALWVRVLSSAASGDSTLYVIEDGTCNWDRNYIYPPYIMFSYKPEFQWVKLLGASCDDPITLSKSLQLGWAQRDVYVDQVYIGYGTPSDGNSGPLPTSGGCDTYNGLCDAAVTCTNYPNCPACPFSYASSCGSTLSSSCPAACVENLPYSCFFDRNAALDAVTDQMQWPTTALTIDFWAQTSPRLQTTDYLIFDYRGASNPGTSAFQIRYSTTSGLSMYLNGYTFFSNAFLTLGNWGHYAVTWRSDTQAVEVFLNGASVFTGTDTRTSVTLPTPGTLYIYGKDHSGSYTTTESSASSFSIDELHIWNAVIPIATISSYFTNPITSTTTQPANLLHSFNFGSTSDPFFFGQQICSGYSKDTYDSTLTMHVRPNERIALRNLYMATRGGSWTERKDWLSGDPCDDSNPNWFAVDCSSNHVITLNLAFNNVTGHFPEYYNEDFFISMPNLQLLFLQGNSISGPVPSAIGYLSSATTIFLQNNKLTSIPSTLSSLAVVQKLYFSSNMISGTIPDVWGSMTSLTYLVLSSNLLTGNVPTSLAACTSLKYLDISYNQLSGVLPTPIMNSQIYYMDLSYNTFGGIMTNRDVTLDNSQMIQMDFSGNTFHCELPPFLRLTALSFKVNVNGSKFFCPVTSAASAVIGEDCDTVTIKSVTPNNYEISNGVPDTAYMTLIATGMHFCSGIQVFVTGAGYITPTFINETALKVKIPYHDVGYVPIRLVWFGDYFNDTIISSNAVQFTYYKKCPVCVHGNCSGISGQCQCLSGYVGNNCSARECPGNCNPPRGTCDPKTGNCTCVTPYFGPSCASAKYACPNNCSQHGTCDIYTGVCSCFTGYWGTNCSSVSCPPNNLPYCYYPNGVCDGKTGKCSCVKGWTGAACNILAKSCPGNCTNANQGVCDESTGLCKCLTYQGKKYGGLNCSQVICDPVCVSPGYCDLSDSLCVCPTGYYGSDCSIVRLTCPNNCTNSSYGDCDSQTGNCTCKTGYTGTNCSQLICPGSPECNYPHGTCNRATAQCVCVNNSLTTGEYYTGYHCQNKYYVCAGKPQCSGTSHGTCNSKTGQCACKYPFNVTLASDCSVASCSNDCYYHGNCDPTNGVCKCLAQYNTTSDCRYLYIACKKDCHYGSCNTQTGDCVCTTGWEDDLLGNACSSKQCPLDCSSHGICHNGTCACNTGWGGSSCSTVYYPCNSTCNSPHGLCNTTSGKCICYGTYFGNSCSKLACLTGIVGTECSGHGTCNFTSGLCACNSNWESPDCAANLCGEYDFCTSYFRGKCNTTKGTCTCYSPYFGNSCENTNCTQPCVHGTCLYQNGTCDCDDSWSGTTCNTWWKTCPPSSTNECSGNGNCDHVYGNCSCMTGYYGEDCSLQLCPNNCSGHGNCTPSTGVCSCESDYQDPYDGSCSNYYLLCTGDGTCNSNGYCNHQNGQCYCYSGYYGTECAYKYCPAHCTEHGTCNVTTGVCKCNQYYNGTNCMTATKPCDNDCSGHGTCNHVLGVCVCTSPFALPDCQYATCNLNCSYPHGVCDRSTGNCTCAEHYEGKGCQIANFACGTCNHNGTCDSTTGLCVCSGGYYGDYCDYKKCPGVVTCSGNGDCDTSTGICDCYEHYSGTACQIANFSCLNDCTNSSNGVCDRTTGTCVCAYPHYGDACNAVYCPNNCWSHGTCDNTTGICTCTGRYLPDDCYLQLCPGNCSGHGICNKFTGVCTCDTDWGEDDCATKLCYLDCSGAGDCVDGKCDCKIGTSGDGCEDENWLAIVLGTIAGCVGLLGASTAAFLLIRHYRIKQAEKKLRERQKAYASAEMSPMSGSAVGGGD